MPLRRPIFRRPPANGGVAIQPDRRTSPHDRVNGRGSNPGRPSPSRPGSISSRARSNSRRANRRKIYHAVGQLDYLAIVALTPDGRFPIVRQYRPALEAFTWELPAGLAEPGEDPARAAGANCSRRPDIPRAPSIPWEQRLPAPAASATGCIPIFCETGDRIDDFVPEPGVAVELVTPVRTGCDDQVGRIHFSTASGCVCCLRSCGTSSRLMISAVSFAAASHGARPWCR